MSVKMNLTNVICFRTRSPSYSSSVSHVDVVDQLYFCASPPMADTEKSSLKTDDQ